MVFIQNGLTLLDPILSLGISLLIIRTGFNIMKTNLDILLDINILDCDDIKNELNNIYGVKHIHNIRTRGTKSSVHVDMHLVVDDNISITQANQISRCCKRTLHNKFPEITEILIQVEPSSGMHDEVHYKLD